MYGLGSLDDCTLGINSGMGGVGYAINNKMQVNPKNPASYAAMDSLTFLFDVGMSVETDWVKEFRKRIRRRKHTYNLSIL